MNKSKVLILDIETSPLLSYCWSLWDQNIALNQINKDWFILSFAAKWLGDPPSKIIYMDQRNVKNIEDDSKLLKKVWDLIDEADVLLTHNGKKFDSKKLNARFIMNGIQPPSSYKHLDTLVIAKKHFGFTSNKLEYLSKKLCVKYKKQSHSKFSGFEMWKQCLANNILAWKEMEVYNKYDVLALEELFNKLIPWDNSVNFNLYTDEPIEVCKCGSTDITKKGFAYTEVGKFQRYLCKNCGAQTRDRNNLFSDEKKKSIKMKV